jgi:single-strand DNA-binding protein
MRKQVENTFKVSGFVGKDATVREFENASVARFSLAISRGEKDKDGKTQYQSAWVNVESWRKNEHKSSFDRIKKGEQLTLEGYFCPENWTDSDGVAHSRIILVATKFYPTPDKAEDGKGEGA